MIYLYGVCTTPGPAIDDAGVEGAPVITLAGGDLSAVCSRVPAPPRADARALLDHGRIVEAILARTTVLPVRFGCVQDDEDAVRALLARRRDAFLDALAAVDGCVEFSVRARWPAPAATASTGRAYLADRMAARGCGDAVHKPLARQSRASTVQYGAQGLTAAYLVVREAQPAFTTALTAVNREPLDLSCTGPWPPYSFVDA
jgi:hypothetical protein